MSAGVDSGIGLAVWLIGVLLGLALVFGPLAFVGWLLANAWRRLALGHQLRALRARWSAWRGRRRLKPYVEPESTPDVMAWSDESESWEVRRGGVHPTVDEVRAAWFDIGDPVPCPVCGLTTCVRSHLDER